MQDTFLKKIDKRICNFMKIDPSYGETLQGQHYQETQEFKAHTDYFEGSQLMIMTKAWDKELILL
jgi:prolyl 4-hydroxylase